MKLGSELGSAFWFQNGLLNRNSSWNRTGEVLGNLVPNWKMELGMKLVSKLGTELGEPFGSELDWDQCLDQDLE
jgi:hypothetical protein